MAIKRYTADADNTITNAFKENLNTRGTGSNMGASPLLEVFSIYAQATTSSVEKARFLVQFPTADISSDRTATTIPASGSVSFFLKLYNARHADTLPDNFKLKVQAVSGSWQEGFGVDMEEYKDLTYDIEGSNWTNRSGSTAWSSPGGDVYALPSFTQTFVSGTENLEIDITEMVEDWLADGGRSNHGLRVALDSAQEDSISRSYYTKKFYAREASDYFYRPCLEARWDSSLRDDANNFYQSSSLAPAADNLNKIFLYNKIRGKLTNIPAIGTGAIYVNLYEASGATPTGSALTLVPNTPATGSHEEAGVYSAEIGLDTTLTSVIPVWYSGATEYHTGSAITVKSVSAKNDNVQNEYVTTVTNLKNSYTRNETARFRLFVREKDWSPTLYTKATSEVESTIIPEAYWKLTRVTDSLDVINYGTGSTNHTKMSYDYSGSYFDFDMSLLERDYAYELRFIYKIDGDYHEQPEVFKFRVD